MIDTASRPFDIITFGDTCVDLILAGGDVTPRFGQVEQLVDGYELELGGSCCIFACQAARLGLRVAVVGKVGPDAFGRLVVEKLAACGVDTGHIAVDPALRTGLSVALAAGGDRAILTVLGSISALSPADVGDELLAQARHLHHGSYFLHTGLRPAMPAIFARARALGLTTSLDTNWDPADGWGGTLADTLAATDLFMPNEQEALRIAGAADLDAAVALLRARAPLLALKRGAQGATLYGPGGRVDGPALPPASGGDSVGAGDSFDAGFLAGWLRGLPLATCMAIAAHCGRAVASRAGGIAGQPTWAELGALTQGTA
jgi:sugar/nucleoside kinase (ribokinase family)